VVLAVWVAVVVAEQVVLLVGLLLVVLVELDLAPD
jgi:hypothetical protein